ncbi:hypothetical protein PRIPAC_80506, partial [Pristionchus pacificus]
SSLEETVSISSFIPLRFQMMRCFFGIFPITWGAMMMAAVLAAAAAGSIVYECLPSNGDTLGVEIFMIAVSALQLIAALLVFYGCIKRRATMLGPVVTLMALIMIGVIVKIILSVASLIAPETMKSVIVATPESTGIEIVVLVVYFWFFNVFSNCFKYLKESESLSEYGQLIP